MWPRSVISLSRCVVGWSMSAAMTVRLVTDALMMAIWRWGKPPALLHHSDRGRQYTSELCQRFMADHGRLLDEPVGQRLETTPRWRALLVTQNRAHSAQLYRTRDEAKADLFDYLERFYNPKRRHSRIGYMSPMEFERLAGLA